ncbi:MAG: rRNA maturation RNase YbeY [Planctomycetes bacterium]|nr:rRNA maturation RNase YbeY [Planctomycetota bacterium]
MSTQIPQRCLIHYIDNVDILKMLCQPSIQIIVNAALADDDLQLCQLNIMFVDSEESAALHQAHFDDASSTDVMSFPDNSYDPQTERTHLGDLAICLEVAQQAGAERGLSTAEELYLYIVHGLLHILGYDDHDDQDRQDMWDKQKELMALLDIDIHDN